MSRALSTKLRQDLNGDDLRRRTGSDIEAWVQGLSDSDRQCAAARQFSASDKKRVWQILDEA